MPKSNTVSGKYALHTDLEVVKGKYHECCKFAKEHEHFSLVSASIALRTVSLLIDGKSEANEDNAKLVEEKGVPRQGFNNSFNNMYLALVMNEPELMGYCEDLYSLYKQSSIHLILFAHSFKAFYTFYTGLASYQIYRETGDSVWLERAKSCKQDIELWTPESSSSHNFAHKLLLLEAEEQYSTGKFNQAKQLHTNGINIAHNNMFINEEALAYQLAAQFYLAIGAMNSSLEHFRLANEKYQTWGACEKARKLLEFVNETFGQ